MKIGVIGLGVLGKAYVKGFTTWRHKVTPYDIKGKFVFEKSNSNFVEKLLIDEIIFILQ